MVAPLLIALAETLGKPLAERVHQWAKGSEVKQLTVALKRDFPEAHSMVLQPSALEALWFYAETGRFDRERMEQALLPITETPARAAALAEAIRTTQWRVMRDARQTHFEFLRLEAQIEQLDIGQQQALQRIGEELRGLAAELPLARQLPAQTDPFVDRERELKEANSKLDMPASGHVAVVLNCSGPAGIGKSAFALELAHRRAAGFTDEILHVDMRTVDGHSREAAEVAAALLRDLGVAPESIPAEPERRLALLRSTWASARVMLVLDNVTAASRAELLIPAQEQSIVIVTSRTPLQALPGAALLDLNELADADAMLLLERIVGPRVSEDRKAAGTIIRCCAGLPLALAAIAGRIRAQPDRSLAEIARQLSESPDVLATIDDRDGTVRATLLSSIADARPPARRMLLLLCALEASDLEPGLLGAVAEMDPATAAALLEELGEARLLSSVLGGDWRVHDLVRGVAAAQAVLELGEDQIASARARRVQWLVESANEHAHDLDGED